MSKAFTTGICVTLCNMPATKDIDMRDLVIKAEDLGFNLTDSYCLRLFPEMKEYRPRQEMALASSQGSYIFHEDYFSKFIEENRKNEQIIARFCEYVEYLLLDENPYLNQLARVALLERCIDIKLYEIRPMIGEKGLAALKDLAKESRMDKDSWEI